ncbi:hypothetical protein KJ359_006753 [Pestalotiopsis sp. 9143b]|nr:hypothetical protein KJ359_006753 [Pestalotiopsis sp. 9143b]
MPAAPKRQRGGYGHANQNSRPFTPAANQNAGNQNAGDQNAGNQNALSLKVQLSMMTNQRDACRKQIESLKAEPLQLRASLESEKEKVKRLEKQVDSLLQAIDRVKRDATESAAKSQEAIAAKDGELRKREQDLQQHKEETKKTIDELQQEAEKNMQEAQKTLEEVKKEGEKNQRELQDEIAKVRAKDVESKREIRRLLGVIRDAAPDTFREEVMKDHLLDIMF